MNAGGWRVSVLDDNVNPDTGATYVLHRVAGVPVATAWRLARFIDEHGSAIIARFPDREPAEQLAARLQVFGLHAVVRHD